ncbi:arginine methyltransferase 1-related [Anaeramoeba flamelloides]|uniref:type I protein arginine methyltransferase n=1 Tax=Anaeramoeba flamelloides TaxID=1746091 RepID=A0AAV8A8A5_9EUKA|nr:arginine methyltransferase 1-related [Anaeramoeba flamelloides]
MTDKNTKKTKNIEIEITKDLDEKNTTKENKKETDYYFDSYSHFGIHEEMLKDNIRTMSYKDAILKNPHLFKDKVVMDVGCGTGILSLFAAKAGARVVIGVECSDIIVHAKKIVEENGYSDVIKLVHAKIEDIKELPMGIKKVDVIISEWMGYCLFYESMVNSVIYARDKWLVEGGVIMPDKSTLYISAMEDPGFKKYKIDFWDDILGFKMKCIQKLTYLEPLVDKVEPESIISNSTLLKTIDLMTVSVEEINFSKSFILTAQKDGNIDAFATFFTYSFNFCHKPIYISTSPDSYYTHWKQTIFYLEKNLPIYRGEVVKGIFTLKQNKNNFRDLDITVRYTFDSENEKINHFQEYRLR